MISGKRACWVVKKHPICHFHGGGMAAEEEQETEEGYENIRIYAVKGFPDGVGDGIWHRGRNG